ncbi:hypothetical protein AB0O07_35700 [Streptomyces sp. NPDC093085]|uniref:hypothetical protein n=1 Tax=Streptomyces sp. NPDC093085 TaxID=3155068 RepID=UPI003428A012
MTTPTPERDSGWISGGLVDAEDARLATGVLAAPGGGPVQARSGIRPAPGDPGRVLATPTASGKVTVNPFQAVIQGTAATAAGAYLVTLDRTKTIDVLGPYPADPTHPRQDLVIARQRDEQYGDAATTMTVELVKGTAAPSPTDPPVTGDHIPLARIRVAGNATAVTSVEDLRPWTAAVGGIIRAAGEAGRPTAPYSGMYIHRTDTNHLESYDTTAGWRAVNDDTGWTPLPLEANWQPYNAQEAPAVRRVGAVVYLRGGATRLNSSAAGNATLLYIPAGFRPAVAHRWYGPTTGSSTLFACEFALYGDRLAVWPDTNSVPTGTSLFIGTTWLTG